VATGSSSDGFRRRGRPVRRLIAPPPLYPGEPPMSRAVHEIQRYLYQQARRKPPRPFHRLMRFVTDWTVMQEAWRRVRSSPGANTPGADRVAARDLPPDSVATRV